MSTQKILMGRDNPDGWKLEELLEKLINEIQGKSDQIKDSKHPQRDMILIHNSKIMFKLADAELIQRSTYKQLDAVEPNKGPLNPRL